MKIEAMDDETVQGIIQKAVEDAVDFIEAEITEPRLKSQRYYDGEVDIGYEDGRSRVVATKCREVVKSLKPSIQRVFLSTENVVEFVPRMPEDVPMCEQMTKFANYKFMQNDGYRLLNDVFQDAMVKKCGIAKVMYEDQTKSEIHEFRNLTDEEFNYLIEPDEVTVLEHTKTVEASIEDEEGLEVETVIHDVKISRQKTEGDISITSIPPEEFFVDRNARSIDDFFVIGHRTDMTIGDLLAMGFDHEEVHNLQGDMATFEAESEFERRNYAVDEDDDESVDPTSRKVVVTEAYMKLDKEGTGKPLMYCFILGGSSYKVLSCELADQVPFAVFEVDPEPHAFFGSSLVDLVMDDQDAATSMLRGVLDNVALTNNPGLEIVDGQVSVDDLLNNEIGRIVRVKQAGSIREQVVPFTAGSTLPALQYFDTLVENKTGVSKASQGLDANVLQSASATAIAATMQGAAGQAEVIARNLAEGGMRRLFKLIANSIINNSSKEEIIRLNNEFVEVDPRSWNADADMMVNVGIGTGREAEKSAVLRETLQMQMSVWQQYGPTNGLVTMTNVRNTLADLLNSVGLRNTDRYYLPVTMESEQQLIQQKQQEAAQQQMLAQGQQQTDPNQAFMATEQMKAQTRAQVDMAKLQLDAQKSASDNEFRMHELAMKDDLQRDEMVQDLAVKVAEILGKYETAVDTTAIKAEQEKVRPHNKEMMDGLQEASY
ncbi:portal protein [uncultured Mediterranean phage uvMED]|nr:portal protein [uncultured Mediterranean phage uvMED]BAR19717.1 portal protein [uncultured Mediterranean phage uvMED]BAR19788.1 portal protein [uncultured Mediterranean phage uvMED]